MPVLFPIAQAPTTPRETAGGQRVTRVISLPRANPTPTYHIGKIVSCHPVFMVSRMSGQGSCVQFCVQSKMVVNSSAGIVIFMPTCPSPFETAGVT